MSGTFGYKDIELEASVIFGTLQAQPVFISLEYVDFGEGEDLAPAGEEDFTG